MFSVPVPPATGPATSREDDDLGTVSFAALLQGASVAAGITHVLFLALFTWAGVGVLACVNVASIACYVGSFGLARRRRIGWAFGLVSAEVVAHGVLASLLLGWQSGFNLYLLLVIPVTVVCPLRVVPKTVAVVAEGLGFLALDLLLRHSTPPVRLPHGVLELFYDTNTAAMLTILAFEAGCYYVLMTQAQAALRLVAGTDPLTLLHNRRSVLELVRHEQARAVRGRTDLSFLMCDVDHFKQVNDQRGHEAGDLVLQAVSGSLRSSVRDADITARWGGEEFLVVLPDTDAGTAMQVAERVRAHVASMTEPDAATRITVTIGVATRGADEEASEAIARADAALFDGKRAGRDRVVMGRTSGSPA